MFIINVYVYLELLKHNVKTWCKSRSRERRTFVEGVWNIGHESGHEPRAIVNMQQGLSHLSHC